PLWYACPFFALFPAAAPHSLDASAKSLASAESPACSCRTACFPRVPRLRIWRQAPSAARAAPPSPPPSALFLLPSSLSSAPQYARVCFSLRSHFTQPTSALDIHSMHSRHAASLTREWGRRIVLRRNQN